VESYYILMINQFEYQVVFRFVEILIIILRFLFLLIEEKELLGESRDKALQRIGDLSITSQDAQQKYACIFVVVVVVFVDVIFLCFRRFLILIYFMIYILEKNVSTVF